ncbi:MAG: diguanylate cyclase [Actinobacteria bacterium]|nr:diguanylate cyclase [Actinomycetota bacterium]
MTTRPGQTQLFDVSTPARFVESASGGAGWPEGAMHPLLGDQLIGLGLSVDRGPSPRGWRQFLALVHAAYSSVTESGGADHGQADEALAELYATLLALRASADTEDAVRFDTLVRTSEVGIVELAPDTRIVSVNPRGERVLGSVDTLVDVPVCDALVVGRSPSERRLERSVVVRAIRSGEPLSTRFGCLGTTFDAPASARWIVGRLPTRDARAGGVMLFQESAGVMGAAMNVARRDSATGLPNQRALNERLLAEVERARHAGRPLSVVIFDVDALRRVNEAFGEEVGDTVVRRVAGALADQVGPGELIARAGGGSFAWLIPGRDAVGAYTAAERARASAAGAARAANVGPVTLSAGICDLRHADTASELLQLADRALSWAKASGQDCTVRYQAEIARRIAPMQDGSHAERMRSLGTIRALARAVDAKDASTSRHSERVAALAIRIAEDVGWPVARIGLLGEAALVHDVGKIGLPDAVLFKPGPLSADEYEAVKEHPSLGARIVEGVLDPEQTRWVLHHHERIDGNGYPDGLKGEQIEPGAQIIALADAWDAMVSTRPYRPALSREAALAECREQLGRQFAPPLVEALHRLATTGALDRLGQRDELAPAVSASAAVSIVDAIG